VQIATLKHRLFLPQVGKYNKLKQFFSPILGDFPSIIIVHIFLSIPLCILLFDVTGHYHRFFLFFKYVIVLLGNVIFLFLLVVSSECGACVTPGRKWICRRYEKSAPATVAQRNVCKSKAALKTVTMTNQ
jgi:hypothetical protein